MPSLLSRLSGRVRSRTVREQALGGQSASSGAAELVAFERRLDRVLTRRRPQLSDIVYRIALDQVRERLGPRWNEIRHYNRIEAILAQSLGADDLYIRYDRNSYLLVFPMLGRREGHLKSVKIAKIIETTLFGADSEPGLVHIELATLADDGTVCFAECEDMGTLLGEPVSVRQTTVARFATEAGTDMHAVDAVPRPHSLADVDFTFRPMLTVQTKIVSTFVAVPIREVSLHRFESGYDVLSNPFDPVDVLHLDQLTVANVLDELRYLMMAGARSLFVIPVHFETLASQRRSREYRRFCIERTLGLEKRIVFEILEPPGNVPQARLLDLVMSLAPMSRTVIARFAPDSFEFANCRASGLHAVGLDLYAAEKNERTQMADLERFAGSAKRNQLRTYVQGVRSLSLLTAALAGGFDYVAGHALGPACRRAEDIKSFRLSELYDPMLDVHYIDGPNPSAACSALNTEEEHHDSIVP
jgi:hypothetical protein